MQKSNASKGKLAERKGQMKQKQTNINVLAGNGNGKSGAKMGSVPMVMKSPSDTTIYAPALKLTPNGTGQGVVERFMANSEINLIMTQQEVVLPLYKSLGNDKSLEMSEDTMNQKISEFLEQVWLVTDVTVVNDPQPSTSTGRRPSQINKVNDTAHDVVVQAEKFRVTVELPRGGCNVINDVMNRDFNQEMVQTNYQPMLMNSLNEKAAREQIFA